MFIIRAQLAFIHSTLRPIKFKRSIHTTMMLFSSAKEDPYGNHEILTVNNGDAPPLLVRWYFAVNNPVSYPKEYGEMTDVKEEPPRFSGFKEEDCIKLEERYLELLKLKSNSNLKPEHENQFKIEVNEDHLFEVDITKMSMAPIYWSGAVYEIRRGTWFNKDGMPLPEDISNELEEGYLKIKPYANISVDNTSNISNPLKKIEIIATDESTLYEFKDKHKEGNKAVYDNSINAYVFNSENMGSLQIANFMKSFQIDPGLDFIKATRGYKIEAKSEPNNTISTGPDLSKLFETELTQLFGNKLFGKSTIPPHRDEDAATQTAMELEIAKDYNSNSKQSNKRKINHLVLCIHGIGQILGSKFEAASFIHTINLFRKNIQKVHKDNKTKQGEEITDDINSGIQVLPIVWRHKVDFKQDSHSLDRLPSLAQITVDEIKPMRNLIGSVLLDILLYYEPYYLKQIQHEVTNQANSILNEFKKRNPDFDGKVSIIGHSLGSVIAFDLLSSQYEDGQLHERQLDELQLDFPVDNYFAIGSPIGVFNLLRRKAIAGRNDSNINNNPAIQSYTLQPKCENFYNIFHPCDPIAYKLEPLITPSLSFIKPASLELDSFVTEVNKKFNSLTEKINTLRWDYPQQAAVSTANTLTKMVSERTEGIWKYAQAQEEEAKKELEHTQKKPKNDEAQNASTSESKKESTYELSKEEITRLTALNYKGRVDYTFDQGLLEISVLSAITAHVSYLEDINTAAFILKELLVEDKTPATKVKVTSVSDKPGSF